MPRAFIGPAQSAAEPERHGWSRQALLTLAEEALRGGRPGEATEWLQQIGSEKPSLLIRNFAIMRKASQLPA